MRILMLTNFFSPHIGGVEKVVAKLSENLRGNQILIITEKYNNTLENKENFNKWTTVYRFSYPHKKYLGLLYIWKWLWQNRNIIQDADLIHIHDIYIWYLPFRFIFPFKPVYMTYHGWEGKLPIPRSSLLQKKLAYYLSKKTMVVGEYLEKYNRINADVITYNGTHVPKTQQKKQVNSFLYVGRLSNETGLDIILNALDGIKDIKIQFCGDGELRRVCEKFGKVHGFLKDPGTYLAKAEFCFAGGFLSTLEAFANKCIVLVCYQNKIKKDYFKMAPFSKYMIIESSPKKLLKRIRYYQTHKKEKDKLAEEAYNWVKTQTWEKVSEEYKTMWGLQ